MAADVSAAAIVGTHVCGASCVRSDVSARYPAMSNVSTMGGRRRVRHRWRRDDNGGSHGRRGSSWRRREIRWRRESNVAKLSADKRNSPPQFRCLGEVKRSGTSFRASQREAQRLRKLARRVMRFADQRFGNIGNTNAYPGLAEIKRPIERQRLRRRRRRRRRSAAGQNNAGESENK